MYAYIIHVLCIFTSIFFICFTEKITYINVEHPKLTYFNTKYIKYANLTTTRYGRSNPIYYVGINCETLVAFGHNITVDIYFYELLSNVYKRSFVEFHFNFCYLIENDPFFGAAMRQGRLKEPCPYPPGTYYLANMTISPAAIPRGFPFTAGRIRANFTSGRNWIGEGHIDMKVAQIDKKKGKF